MANDYSSIVDLYDLYVTDTGDHPFWSRCAAEADGPILELTAGTGRATTALRAGSAHPLVALDINPGMLRRLLDRFRDGPGVVRAVAGDMVTLPFAADRFALAVIPLNAFGEVVAAGARAAVLHEMRRVLKPGGRAVITLHDPAHRRPALDGTARRLGPFATPDGRLEVVVRGRLLQDEVAESEQTYRLLDACGTVVEERQVRLRFAIPDAPALLCAAARAGLELLGLYGDYDRAPYIAGSSPYIVAVLGRTRAAAGPRP